MAANDALNPDSQPATPNDWCQGDVILATEELPFVYWADLSAPLTDASTEASGEEGADLDVVSDDVEGFVVVTQTCDMARDPKKRPYVELAPLVQVDAGQFKQIAKLSQPRYVVVPGIAEKQLVADLDRIMTIEKSVLQRFERIEGLSTDEERRQFARALARKRARPALPDGFNECFKPLAEHLKAALKKDDEEARHLDALAEFRVKPEKNWDEERVVVTLYLLKGQQAQGATYDWVKYTELWKGKFKASAKFTEIHLQVTRFDQIDAHTYLTSDELDLDNLSPPT